MGGTEGDNAVLKSDAETSAEPTAGDERWSRLEKLVRGMGRDSLSLARDQQEARSTLATIVSRMDELDLAIKGLAQTSWRAAQERLTQAQDTEKHFAGALRELESRMREEILWQAERGTLAAIFPALDDMVRVLDTNASCSRPRGARIPSWRPWNRCIIRSSPG